MRRRHADPDLLAIVERAQALEATSQSPADRLHAAKVWDAGCAWLAS
jgi:hypothetical protein